MTNPPPWNYPQPAYLDYPENHPLFATTPPPVIQAPSGPATPEPVRTSSAPAVAVIIALCVVVIVVIVVGAVILADPLRATSVSAPSTVTSVSVVTPPPPPSPLPPPPAPPATTVVVVPPPVIPAPKPAPVSGTCQWLRSQANADYSVVSSEATGLWVPQLSSKQPGLVADGITWDCNSILAEHLRLRGLYGAKLLWSEDWPHTYGHDDYWVTVAGYTYGTAEGARQWCQDHGRDVPEHCYPKQIR